MVWEGGKMAGRREESGRSGERGEGVGEDGGEGGDGGGLGGGVVLEPVGGGDESGLVEGLAGSQVEADEDGGGVGLEV